MKVDIAIELIPIGLILISLIIAAIPFIRTKKKLLSADENELIRYISLGANIIVKRFIVFGLYAAIVFIFFIFLANILGDLTSYRVILIVISFVVSTTIGWVGLRLAVRSLNQLLHFSSSSLGKLYQTYQLQSRFILVVITSISIFDLSIWFLTIDLLTSYNILNFGKFCAEFFGFEWTATLTNDSNFINYKHCFVAISLLGYVIGATLQSLLARFNTSLFSVPLDTSGDIVGFTDYDFHEDELKNPVSIPDQVGDQYKGTFLLISELYSILVIFIVALAILGGKVGLSDTTLNSITLIELPLIFIATGLFVMLIVRTILTKIIKEPKNIFKLKIIYQCIIALIFAVIFSIFYQLGFYNIQIYMSVFVGLITAIIWYITSHSLFGYKSKAISFVKKCSINNVIGAVTSGLFIGFINTVITGALLVLMMAAAYFISGNEYSIITNFYNIGLIGLGLLIGSLTLISDSICLALVDNAIGISSMLSLDKSKQLLLKRLKIICSATTGHIKTVSFGLIVLISGVFLMVTMTQSMEWLKVLQNAGYNTIHHLSSMKLQFFDITHYINEFIFLFEVHFLDIKFFIGLLLGMTFLFGIAAYIMFKISNINDKITNLIYQEYEEKKDVLEGYVLPNYIKFIDILSKNANKNMLFFLGLIFFVSVPTYCIIGIPGTIGFILSQIFGGFVLNTFFVTCGTIWSNAKTSEEINKTDLDTSKYASLFFTDKLGDLFKDALGPCISNYVKFNILFIIVLLGLILEINERVFF
ncbi:hypothetical protein DID76_02575 [Candidatus Marinamargulisbacteria bacterium SCGC AG-414-C22]|nr:hypothetical protein DID76_02575 [Candidatus Marinamargulisbacteria bacterium SCGC AG-414-C22]